MIGFMGSSYGQYESLAAIEDNDCSANSVNKDDLQNMVVKAAEDARYNARSMFTECSLVCFLHVR
jgi:hypothetical protein